jgi:hypothetical protein
MVSDHDNSDRNNDGWDSPHIWDDLMTNNVTITNPFGMNFDYVDISGISTNVANLPTDPFLHGPMGNVTEVQWSDGTTITLSPSHNSSVVGVVYKSGSAQGNTNCLVAHSVYGSGRVAALGDSSPCDDGSGDPGDQLYDGWITDANGNHEKLIVNATIWLASSVTTGIPVNETPVPLTFSPNPVHDRGTFSIGTGYDLSKSQIRIYSLTGKEIFSERTITSNEVRFDASQLSPGFYYYLFLIDGKITGLGKILKD